MTKEPQPTTHNAERGARDTCRERLETGSSPKRIEKKVSCSLIGKRSWRFGTKCLATLEQKCGEIRWRFVENIFGDLEKTYSAESFGDLEKSCSAEKSCSTIWRNRVRRFGETWSTQLR